jgi:hypothetical protein
MGRPNFETGKYMPWQEYPGGDGPVEIQGDRDPLQEAFAQEAKGKDWTEQQCEKWPE